MSTFEGKAQLVYPPFYQLIDLTKQVYAVHQKNFSKIPKKKFPKMITYENVETRLIASLHNGGNSVFKFRVSGILY
ncbi:MAG: hypothetical protein KME64_16950 [Scytonematopsis contorta HA4267-MV1]|nr:hypothetical protein [Scytonematopsis contorta HA4267-MV1]